LRIAALRLLLRPREWLYICLHKRALEFIEAGYRPVVDVNEDNVALVTSSGEVRVYGLSRLKEAGYGYLHRRRAVQRRYHGDRRVLRKALGRLSRSCRSLVDSELHKVSSAVAKLCKWLGGQGRKPQGLKLNLPDVWV